MLKLNHKDLTVYKKSIDLVKEIYLLTNELPPAERFGLQSQLRRASVSIPSNISEGSARKSEVERKRFYEIARSSLVEIDSQIEISLVLGYLEKHKISKLEKLANEVFAMLSSMV
ncbi:MAG: four helix bundle protein [Cyclonatronaceae bacterium]